MSRTIIRTRPTSSIDSISIAPSNEVGIAMSNSHASENNVTYVYEQAEIVIEKDTINVSNNDTISLPTDLISESNYLAFERLNELMSDIKPIVSKAVDGLIKTYFNNITLNDTVLSDNDNLENSKTSNLMEVPKDTDGDYK